MSQHEAFTYPTVKGNILMTGQDPSGDNEASIKEEPDTTTSRSHPSVPVVSFFIRLVCGGQFRIGSGLPLYLSANENGQESAERGRFVLHRVAGSHVVVALSAVPVWYMNW